MKLVLAEPKLFKESISAISSLVNEVTMRVDKNMLEILAMDPANVAMVIFHMVSAAFMEYDVKKEEYLTVSLDNLNQILRRAKPSDTMHIELDEKKGRLMIKLVGESSRTFHIALLDSSHREQKIPELNFPAKVEMSSAVFNDSMEDMNVTAESVLFSASENSFVMKSESKFSSAKVELTTDDSTTIKLDKASNVESKYSLEYLNKIAKGSKLADNVLVQFGNEYPLKIDYKVIDKLNLSIILAPRVMND